MMAVECCDNLPTARSTSDATYIAQGTPVSLTMPRGQATPAFSLTITAGKQANVQVGSFGLEANLGAREIFSTSSFGERTAPANTTVTTSGFSASYGAGTIGAEKKVTTTQGESSIPTAIAGISMKTLATTTTEYTSNMGVGLGKTGLSANLEGGKTTTSYLLPSGITTAPTVTGRNTTTSIGGSDMRPGAGGTTKGGTTFSIGFGVKVEVKVDLKQAWENIKKYGF